MRLLVILLCLLMSFCAYSAQVSPLKSGTYRLLPLSAAQSFKPTKAGDITVVEFFSLACPHCADFDPTLEAWLKTKPNNVEFRRIAVGFGRESWKSLARLYYVSVALGNAKTMVPMMFDALHKQNIDLSKQNTAEKFFADKTKISKSKFDSYYNSYSIRNQVEQGDVTVQKAGVMSVPTLVVNGEYEVNPSLTGSFKGMISALNTLISNVKPVSSNTDFKSQD